MGDNNDTRGKKAKGRSRRYEPKIKGSKSKRLRTPLVRHIAETKALQATRFGYPEEVPGMEKRLALAVKKFHRDNAVPTCFKQAPTVDDSQINRMIDQYENSK